MGDVRSLRTPAIWNASLVAGLALVLGGVVIPVSDVIERSQENDGALRSSLQAVDTALASGDVAGAADTWLRAHGQAQRARSWEALLAVGEASLKVGTSPGARIDATARARRLFLAALFRAQDARSLDGVLAASNAFASLGDRETVEQGIRIGRRIAGPDLLAQDRIRRFEETTRAMVVLARRAS